MKNEKVNEMEKRIDTLENMLQELSHTTYNLFGMLFTTEQLINEYLRIKQKEIETGKWMREDLDRFCAIQEFFKKFKGKSIKEYIVWNNAKNFKEEKE